MRVLGTNPEWLLAHHAISCAAASEHPRVKLCTFARGGTPLANSAFEAANASAPTLAAPVDMKQLIGRYDYVEHTAGI